MSKGLVRGLTLAALAALGTMTCVASAGAATAISSCTTLGTLGATYVLTSDLASCGTCLVVAEDRITIDLAGHTISGSCGGAGVTDGGMPDAHRQWTTVKNGTIRGFEIGVSLGSSTRNVIRDLEASDNAVHGLLLGPRSLVKGCLIERNGQYGINIGDFGQVQDSTIAGPVAPGSGEGFGIVGGTNLLITNNWVVGNLSGIVVGNFSTVSFNTSSGNSVFGVLTGNRSLVTGNTTSENGDAGIATGGRSSVTYNTSNGNGGGGIGVGVDGFFDSTQNLVTGNTTNDNGDVGVATMCPSTVTNNRSSGNGLNYDIGPGCRTNNNK